MVGRTGQWYASSGLCHAGQVGRRLKEGMGCRRSWIVVGNCEALCRAAVGQR